MTQHYGIIYWKIKDTGVTGHGRVLLSFSRAKADMIEGNKNFPFIDHWFIPILRCTA